MPRALYTAATGMMAQQLNIDVIANNLANVNTAGFKKSQAEFQDLIYQTMRTAGSSTSRESVVPQSLQVGHGSRPIATERSFTQGDLRPTENPLDVAIEGDGLFQVRLPGNEIAFTRAGSIKVDNTGRLVNNDGYPLEPPITVPPDMVSVNIARDGLVTVTTADRGPPVEIGSIQLARVLNTGALEGMGKNLYRVAGDVGDIQIGTPGQDGLGTLAQGFIEGSNVNVVEEMIAMIVGQRAYEANSKVIQASDRMLEETNRLR